MWTPSISIPVDGSWCWRRLVAHHRTSVLSELSCSLFDFIQVAMSSAHSVTWKCIHSSRRTRAVYLRIIGVKMRRQTMAFNHGVMSPVYAGCPSVSVFYFFWFYVSLTLSCSIVILPRTSGFISSALFCNQSFSDSLPLTRQFIIYILLTLAIHHSSTFSNA